jgi:hypothetical protein
MEGGSRAGGSESTPIFPGEENRAARREPRSLEAAGAHGLGVSRESDWGGSRALAFEPSGRVVLI